MYDSMKKIQHTTGYSLVETLVAVSILLLSIVGPMTIASKGIQTGIFVGDQTTAVFLAQEQVESVMAIRNQYALENLGEAASWDWVDAPTFAPCFAANGCNITWNNQGDPLYEVTACTTASNNPCKVFLDTSSSRARFNSERVGVETMYTRVLKLQDLGDREVIASSTVTWNSKLFGGSRGVSLRSSFFNIYDYSD